MSETYEWPIQNIWVYVYEGFTYLSFFIKVKVYLLYVIISFLNTLQYEIKAYKLRI